MTVKLDQIKLDAAWIEGYHQAIKDGIEADKKVKAQNQELKLTLSAYMRLIDNLDQLGRLEELEDVRLKNAHFPRYMAIIQYALECAEIFLANKSNHVYEIRLTQALDRVYAARQALPPIDDLDLAS